MNPRLIGFAVALVTSLGVLSAPAVGADSKSPAPAQVTAKRLALADRDPADWMTHGRTYSEQRYSPLDRINTGAQ